MPARVGGVPEGEGDQVTSWAVERVLPVAVSGSLFVVWEKRGEHMILMTANIFITREEGEAWIARTRFNTKAYSVHEYRRQE